MSILNVYEIMQIPCISSFDKTPGKELLTETLDNQAVKGQYEIIQLLKF
jgi:hypothetical protein